AGLELGHVYSHDGLAGQSTGVATPYGSLRVAPGLDLGVEQQVVGWTDASVHPNRLDQFATTLRARYQLGDTLYLSAAEAVRWSGTHTTELGLRTATDSGLNLYVAERFVPSAFTGRPQATTVVGGESVRDANSRSYFEYQLGGLLSAERGRAVLGMDNRWGVAKGLFLSLFYERTQLVGRVTLTPEGYAMNEPGVTGYGSSPLGRDQQFSASGYDSAGTFPVGVASRDAFAVGIEHTAASAFKASARAEMRYDRGDAAYDTPDRMLLGGQAGCELRVARSLVALARARGASVHSLGFPEGQYLDVSLGLALRPAHAAVFTGLLKWTRRYERRAVDPEKDRYQLAVSDVLAVEPVMELGHGFQVVGKGAVKVFEQIDADLPAVRTTTLLGVGRLNYHLTRMFDVGGEYRWLRQVLLAQTEHGALVEAAWLPVDYVSVGLGYNFTHFADDLLAPADLDHHGAFLRIVGRY
ncbi:MAG: hypothetical protein HYZ27_10780, partial [Deltaproteobacteria bacterium]|nr:hypothetical protein [Deltaproteobacteria bacterium]